MDKIVEKYHDKAFDKFGKHSSAWHRRHDRQQQQREYPEPYVSELSYKDRATLRERDDRNLDSNMYAPDRWQGRDYQDRKETRHLLDETFYYRGPDAGTVVMRGSDPYNNTREYGVAVSSCHTMGCAVLIVTSNTSNPSTIVGETTTANEDALHPGGAAHHGRRNVQDETTVILAVLARDRGQWRRRIALQPQWLEV